MYILWNLDLYRYIVLLCYDMKIVGYPGWWKHDVVITVVDSVSKRIYFILTHTIVTIEGVARLFLYHVWKLHKLSRQVVSDRGLQFIILFTWELYRLLEIRLAFFTTWHPQIDRQTEHVNQELDQYLCIFVNKQQNN